MDRKKNIRNMSVIAHVDHGKLFFFKIEFNLFLLVLSYLVLLAIFIAAIRFIFFSGFNFEFYFISLFYFLFFLC